MISKQLQDKQKVISQLTMLHNLIIPKLWLPLESRLG